MTEYVPTIPVVRTTNPSNRGNLRLKSLTLRELEADSAISLAIDFSVVDRRLQFLGTEADVQTHMFSALGSTLETTTLSVSSILGTDVSAAGVSTFDVLSVNAVTSSLSVHGDVIAPYLSVETIDVGTVNVFGANTLSVGGAVIFAGEDFQITNAEGKFEVGSNLSVGRDIFGASSLTVLGKTVCSTDTSVGGELVVSGDVILGQNLSLSGNDVTLDSNLSVSGELAVRKAAVFDQELSVQGDVTAAGNMSVGGAVRLSSMLSVMDTSTFGQQMSVGSFVVAKDSVSVGGDIIGKSSLSIGALSTLYTLSAGSTTADSLNVRNNLSVHGDLFVEGTTVTLNTSVIDIEDPIIEIGSGEALAGVKIVKNEDKSQPQAGFFREMASNGGLTPAFFAVYEDFSDTEKVVGNWRAAQLSTSGEAFLGGPLSIGGSVYAMGGVVLENDLSLGGATVIDSTLSVGGESKLEGSVQTSGSLSVASHIVSSEDLSVAGSTTLASSLSVSSAVMFGASLSVGGSTQLEAALVVRDTLSTGGSAVVDGSLSLSSDAVMAGVLSVHGSGTLASSLSVADVAVMTPSSGTNVFVPQTTLSLITAEGTGLTTIMEFDERPLFVKAIGSDGSGLTPIVFTDSNSQYDNGTGVPIEFDVARQAFVVKLQYRSGTSQPVLAPRSFEVAMDRPYVTTSAFRVISVDDMGAETFLHNELVDGLHYFSAGSGQVVPTLSVSGDIVAGTALSVGHDLHCNGNTLFSNASSRVGILGRLSVADDTNINKRLIIGGDSDAFLSVGCAITAMESLSVGGTSSFSQEVSVGATTYFADSVLLNDTLSVAQSVTLAHDLSVAANEYVGMNLSVGEVTTTNSLSVHTTETNYLSTGQAEVQDMLHVVGPSRLDGTVVTESSLSVGVDGTVGNNLSVGANLDVSSDCNVGNSLSVQNDACFDAAVYVKKQLAVVDDTVLLGKCTVAGDLISELNLSVGANAEVAANASVRGTHTVNNNLSVGQASTFSRDLSVGDSITAARDLSLGGLVLARERTNVRYYPGTNNGLKIKTVQADVPFILDLFDGRRITILSALIDAEYTISSPSVRVRWFEMPPDIAEQSGGLVISDLSTDASVALELDKTLEAGLTALSVAHNMVIGKENASTFLSIGSELDITGRTQISNTLSVTGSTTLAAQLSVEGDIDASAKMRLASSLSVGGATMLSSTLSVHENTTITGALSVHELDVMSDSRMAGSLSVSFDADIMQNTRLHGDLAVQGETTINNTLSVAGEVFLQEDAILGAQLSVAHDTTLGANLEVTDSVSVGGALTVRGASALDSSLTVTGASLFNNRLDVLQDVTVAENLSISGHVDINSSLSLAGIAVLNDSLSVASILATPESGINRFLFQTVVPANTAKTLRITMPYPHQANIVLANSVIVALSAATFMPDTNTYVSEYVASGAITEQVNGFEFDPTLNTAKEMRFLTPEEVLSVDCIDVDNIVTTLHTRATPTLVGGRQVPSLSVGGRMVVLENLSVGFDTTIEADLSVSGTIQSSVLSVANVFSTKISTQSLYVAESDLNGINAKFISVAEAYIEQANIVALSVQDTIFTDGQTVTLVNDLSVGGDAQMNLISVANLHVNMLSVSDAYASELSVHTLFVQRVTTSEPGEQFDFQDDAYFQGDLSIEGKLYVKDIIYTGPGGAFTIENVAGLTVEHTVSGQISTASLFLDLTHPPTSSSDTGRQGVFTVDQQYLYVCIEENEWRRVAMSAF